MTGIAQHNTARALGSRHTIPYLILFYSLLEIILLLVVYLGAMALYHRGSGYDRVRMMYLIVNCRSAEENNCEDQCTGFLE